MACGGGDVSISYASYLMKKFVFKKGSIIISGHTGRIIQQYSHDDNPRQEKP